MKRPSTKHKFEVTVEVSENNATISLLGPGGKVYYVGSAKNLPGSLVYAVREVEGVLGDLLREA